MSETSSWTLWPLKLVLPGRWGRSLANEYPIGKMRAAMKRLTMRIIWETNFAGVTSHLLFKL